MISLKVTEDIVNLSVGDESSINLSVGGLVYYDEHERYDGQYEFTSTNEVQIINTKNMILGENITIKPIPSNYGAIGWNGSFLTVS